MRELPELRSLLSSLFGSASVPVALGLELVEPADSAGVGAQESGKRKVGTAQHARDEAPPLIRVRIIQIGVHTRHVVRGAACPICRSCADVHLLQN